MTQQPPSIPDPSDVYFTEALAQAARLLGMLDREPDSASYGCMDRDHWAWKFRDFPLGMLQCGAYPLALLWNARRPGNPYYQNAKLLEWIFAAIRYTIARQRRSGHFDAFCPFEHDPGPTLGMMHGILESFRLLRDVAPTDLRDGVRKAVRAGADAALLRPETHGFISNHRALFAVALLDAHELLGDEKYRRASEELVDQIIERQSPDGWYDEYGGPDPGYETLGIHHLANYWRRAGTPAGLLESLRRSVDFLAHCVHPDGSVGGVYGSRHTSLYFPGGLEILAPEVPAAAAMARFMRERLVEQNVVTLRGADTENLVPLLYSYLEASQHVELLTTPRQPLPCETLQGMRCFPDAGISFVGTPNYYAIVAGNKGGVCRIYDRRSGRIAYEDAGYIVASGRTRWTSQWLGSGRMTATNDDDQLECAARFVEIRQELPTPIKFIVLRLLNLTAFRSRWLSEVLRKQIVRRLILVRKPGPLSLKRAITFETDRVLFKDSLHLSTPLRIDAIKVARSFTAPHMGSAKYFHASELEDVPERSLDELAAQLRQNGRGDAEFVLDLSTDGTAPASPHGAAPEGETRSFLVRT
jgi:hypothetical protein